MIKEKQKIYLTDITLHTKEMRQTINFSKASIKGRVYSPLPKNHAADTPSKGNSFKISINLPPDLKAKLDRGEAELMIPEGGLFVYAGKDIQEKLDHIKNKERTQTIHRSRGQVWRSE